MEGDQTTMKAMTPTIDSRLCRRLREETRCEVRFDPGTRGLYATDASLYEIMPIGVALPRTRDDAAAAMTIAAEEGVAIVPRGAATSLSGQTIGEALVIDCSKYLNRVGIVDRATARVHVEAGVVLDQLNSHLKPLGLMFGPDVSTSDRATIGGMIGNNSAGARSLKYGKMVDHVESLEVVLSDGSPVTLSPLDDDELDRVCSREDLLGRVHRVVRQTVSHNQEEIAARFPRILRRVSGYNLDEFVPGLPIRPQGWVDEPWRFNLARLVVGSEGTLAMVTGAMLKLVPAPAAQGLVVLSFSTIQGALERLHDILDSRPASIEMIDRTILDLAAANPEYSRYLTFYEGEPEAVLAAQIHADSAEDLAQRSDRLLHTFQGQPGVLGVRIRLNATAKDDFWKVRKAGLSLLMGMLGDAKPVAFVEDTAVDPAKLPDFYRRFMAILSNHGTIGSCYGHADVGCLHIRPILNTKNLGDVEKLRSIAREVSDLVLEFGGAMSGEHGDGLARSGWNAKLFGPTIYHAFETIKRTFDPENRMNPGKVVASPDPGADLRQGPDYHASEPIETIFDYSGQGGFARAVEMCSGVGACRKTDSGTMCPSYMITRDEEHSTRGRANLLRLVMSGALPADGLANEALDQALDLCLQCKACKTECPSNVDMAKLKAEVLHQTARVHGIPLSYRLMGNLHRFYPFGSAIAPVSNWLLDRGLVKWLQQAVLGIDRRRTLPKFASRSFRAWFRHHQPARTAGTKGKVVLLDDCFTNFNTPSVGQAAVALLEAAGHEVELAGLGCCGRPAISKGLLKPARALAIENVEKLLPHARAGVPILGLEPSCLTVLIDEYLDFRLGDDAKLVAGKAMMIDAFLVETTGLALRADSSEVLLHGHCQQKALLGTDSTVKMLRMVPDLRVNLLDSGCCGMAGSFGYELGHYDLSVALANRVLLPAAQSRPDSIVLAPGFSCRSQLHDLGNTVALHPVEFLARQLMTIRPG